MTRWTTKQRFARRAGVWALLALGCGIALAQTPGARTDPGAAAATPLSASSALATPAAPVAGPPPNFVAPPAPRADENNAQRARSQPGNNAPFWRAVRDSGNAPGYSSLPGAEKGVLIQPFVQYPGSSYTTAGEAWRQVRNQWLVPYGGALLLIVTLAIAIFHWRKGTMGRSDGAGQGRRIERFTPLERAAHWTNAVAFVTLAVSGIVMAFGKHFLLPVMGSTLFGWLAHLLKTLHNLVGPLFAVSLAIVFFTFLKDNLPRRGDWTWLRHAGGMFSDHEVPSHRFNAGEKVVFWGGVLLLGAVVVASGLVLDQLIPGWGDTRGEMQVAHMVHATATVLMMAMFLGHIYMGTLGMRGAYRSMRTGYVDEAWAHEHHELWYDDILAGRIPAQRSAPEAGTAPPLAARNTA